MSEPINNLADGTTLDPTLLAELERIGLQVLKKQVRHWDHTRGVTFDVFVRPRLAEAMERLISLEVIRDCLARATGQRPEYAKLFLRDLVAFEQAGRMPNGWRGMVETEYPKLLPSLDWVSRHDVDGHPLKPARRGRNQPRTQEQRKLITDHLPLVRKLALERASEVNNLAGGTTLDPTLLAELERIGLEVLEEKILDWDPTRGVTFGAFVRPRLAGGMDNYLTRERIKTAISPADALERWKSEAHGARAKGNRTSTGGRKVKSYAEHPTPHRARLIKASSTAFDTNLAEALAQLTPNQRAVYEGRVLAEPPLSLGELAHRLKVSRPRIVALEKKAHRRMGDLLHRRGG